MDKAARDDLRGLLGKADQYGWQVDGDGDLCARVPTCWIEGAWQDEGGRANAALIVAAINALPSLLDAAERVERLEAALREIAAYAPGITHGWAVEVRAIAARVLIETADGGGQ